MSEHRSRLNWEEFAKPDRECAERAFQLLGAKSGRGHGPYRSRSPARQYYLRTVERKQKQRGIAELCRLQTFIPSVQEQLIPKR